MRTDKSIKFSSSSEFILTTILLLLTLLSSPKAWSALDDELIEEAKKEGKLMIYHANNILTYEPVIKNFMAKYPFIKVDSFQASRDKLLVRILAEEKAKRSLSDIYDARSFQINILKERGLLMKYISPNFKSIPPTFIDPEGYYWANCFAVVGIAYNTKLISPNDVPRNYNDLLQPKWKGKLYLEYGDYEWYANILEIMGKEKGLDFMKKLSMQNIQFRNGKVLMDTLVAAGEIPIFLTAAGSLVEQLKEKGAPINWVAFDTIIGIPNAMGIFSHAPHPNAAKLFVNFIASKEGQEILVMNNGKIPVRPDAKVRYHNLQATVKERKLHFGSITTDYTKFNKEFRTLFIPR